MRKTLWAVAEETPGAKWQQVFERGWDGYKSWFLREGVTARPTYLESVRALRKYMPELLHTYEQVVELAGGGDVAARLLSLYRPTPYMSACSQAAWGRKPVPALIRNYDYAPALWDASVLRSAWNGRTIIAMTDCAWGVLDGISESGIAVSLAFGGRRVVGDGFGIPLVLRYVLEFADSLREAVRMIRRVPSHMAYNVTVMDGAGRAKTVHVSPDRRAVITRKTVATNHQRWIEWGEYVKATHSLEREEFLKQRLRTKQETREAFIGRFLKPPVYASKFDHGWGTLYTAVYEPQKGTASFLWPDQTLTQSLSDFQETRVELELREDLTVGSNEASGTGA